MNINVSGGSVTPLVTTSGYVALLDVLGFRPFVANDRKNKGIIGYLRTVKEALADSGVESVVFSDSIVLTKQGDDPENLRLLCRVCSSLMFALISESIPVRGAIAHGSYAMSRLENSTFIAGTPIIEAYDFERRQNWIGIILAPPQLRQHARSISPSVACTARI